MLRVWNNTIWVVSSKYALKAVITEAIRCRRFEDGLNESIKRYLEPVTSLQQVNFYQLLQASMKVEKSEMSNQERNHKRKLTRGGSSSGKRIRESQAESMYSSAARGRRRGLTIAPSSDRGTSIGQGEIPKCPHFHKRHSGIFIWLTRGCFRCGSIGHLLENCPRESENLGILEAVAEEDQTHIQQLVIEVEVEVL